jgi:putative ABC transport system permease protein
MTRSRLSAPGLLARHLVAATGPAVLVAVLVALAVLAVALAPRAVVRLGTEEVRARLTTESPLRSDVAGLGWISLPYDTTDPDAESMFGKTDDELRALPDRLDEPFGSALAAPQWVARTVPVEVPADTVHARMKLTLAFDLAWSDRIRIVSGALPEADPDPEAPVEIAVSAATADATRLAVGDVISLGGPLARVSGVFEPVDPVDPYWDRTYDIAEPFIEEVPGKPVTVRAGVYVDPDSIATMQDAVMGGTLAAWYPIIPGSLDYPELTELRAQSQRLLSSGLSLPDGGHLDLSSGLALLLDDVTGRVAWMSTLLALSLSGLAGVLAAALALGVRTLVARQSAALALLGARGAGGWRRRAALALEGLLIGLPTAAAALVAAELLVPTTVGLDAWIPGALIALAPAALLAALPLPKIGRGERPDLRVRGGNRSRFVAEVAVVALALVALFLLARRGVADTAALVGVDPLLAATPLLLALAGCVLALRFYPLPLLLIQRRLRRASGATGMLGAARAARDPALGFAAGLAVVVGVSVVVLSAVLSSTVRAGLEQGARDAVGADVQLSTAAFTSESLQLIELAPGVVDVAALTFSEGRKLTGEVGGNEVTVVVADTAALHAVRPDIPVLTTDGGDAPILVSTDLLPSIRGTTFDLDGIAVQLHSAVADDLLPGVARRWVLIDATAARALDDPPRPERVLIDTAPGTDPEVVAQDLTHDLSSVQAGLVVSRDVTSALRDARTPVIVAFETSQVLSASAALLLTALTLVLASAGAAAGRNRVIGVLRVLGMSARQIRRVLAWELGPLAVVAVVVGTALGLLLPWIVTSVLDLSPFLGGRQPPGVVVEPLTVLGSIAAFILVVVAASIVALLLGRRLAPAGALKMGEQ